jgi:hemolysin D
MSRAQADRQRHPAIDLACRYRDIFSAAWALRAQLAGPKRLRDETAFLPAALSLQESPAHPAPRRAAWAICALFVIALAWACLGEIDIVAVAPGRVVVSERVKTVQPLEASIVRRVLVQDGESVGAGQVLVELDATNASADMASVHEQLASADSEARRTSALIEAMRRDRSPVLRPSALERVEGAAEQWRVAADADTSAVAQLAAEWQDITAKLARLGAEQSRRRAEMQTVRELIAKLEATLPIARQRESDFKSLTDQGFVSAHAGQDRTRERIEQERDLATQQARLVEARSALAESEQARVSYAAETSRSLSERHAQAVTKREQLLQERNKNEQRSRLTLLRAPVAGTVQQLGVHTEGGIVTPAQVLMIVVPKDAEVTAEVVVDNKDIGFVNVGDPARVKLETFPFTRYGTIDARVRTVTADAVVDEKRGAIFPATLALARSAIDVDGKRIHLSPGMNLTAEIKTGKRRVIEYLLSPVQQTLGESLGER